MRGILIIFLVALSASVAGQNIRAYGMVRQADTWHMFGGFEDSAVVISVTQSQYSTVSNAAGDLWTGIEADGISMSGDTMTIDNPGDYFGEFSVTFTGSSGNVYKFQVYDITAGEEEGFSIAATGDGTNDYVTVTKPLYFEDVTAGRKYIMRCTNIDASNDPTVRFGAYFLTYLHD